MSISYEFVGLTQNIYVNNSGKKLPSDVIVDGKAIKVRGNINIKEKDEIQYCFLDNNINFKQEKNILTKLKEIGYDIINIRNSTTIYLKFKYDNLDFIPMLIKIANKHRSLEYSNKSIGYIILYNYGEVYGQSIYYDFKNKDKFVYIDYRYKNLIDELIEEYNKPEEKENITITKEMRLFKLDKIDPKYCNNKSTDNILTVKRRFYYGRNPVWSNNFEFYSDMTNEELKKELINWFGSEFSVKCKKDTIKSFTFKGIDKNYYEYNDIKYYCFDEDEKYYYILDKYYEKVKEFKKEKNFNENWETV